MNESLQQFARQQLKDGLAKLPEGWQNMFKRMYGNRGGKLNLEEVNALPIGDVVDRMPDDQLDRAMEQVENSLKKIAKQSEAK